MLSKRQRTFRNLITPKNSYGAVYLPWVRTPNPTGQSAETILVPPSGFVAGLYAKTDGRVGVWKAPAGTSTALGGAVGLAVPFTDVQQGNLNPHQHQCHQAICRVRGRPVGRPHHHLQPTVSLYFPVRRMAIFLRVSTHQGIQWAVFEPNDEDLWASLRLNINSFMMNLFARGPFRARPRRRRSSSSATTKPLRRARSTWASSTSWWVLRHSSRPSLWS